MSKKPGHSDLMRSAFRILNKFFMVPAFRLGLGPLLGSPYGGYIMVLKVCGRVSGKTRHVPVNYAIRDGYIYWTAGFGEVSDWVKNIRKDPDIELMLPTITVTGKVETILDEPVRQLAFRQIMINSGFAAFAFGGFNPYRLSDARLAEVSREYVIFRLQTTIGSGPADPGGWLWIWPTLLLVLITYFLIAWLVR